MLKLGEFVHCKAKPVLESLGVCEQTSNVSKVSMLIFLDILDSGYHWLCASRRWGVEKQWEFTKCPRSTIESTLYQEQCLKSLEIFKEAFYVFRRIESENSWKWNKFKTVMHVLPSKHFPAAWSLPQNTAYFAFSPDLSHLFRLRPLFQGSLSPSHILPSYNACCLPHPDKNTRKKQCFDSTLRKRAYKAFEWEAKFVWVMRGVLPDVDYF